MVVNEAHSPIESVRGSITTSFHRSLLQIIYFCARQSRNMAGRPKFLTAENRLAVSSMVDATHVFVVDSLRFVFGTARMRLDADIDVDLELLVAVFKECTRRDISPSSTQWLTRCQETDVIRASLELFVQTDLTGLSTLPFSRRKQPLYSPHILTFHVALASLPGPAERLASEGILIAYSNSRLGTGPIDVTLPELPGERNPAHTAYCVMLAVVSGVFSSLGMQKHFFGAEASGFVRLFGNQIAGVLAWTVGDPISLALVEEMERVVELFHAIAMSASSAGGSRRRGERAGPTEGVLAAFSTNALLLLQQLNYALTHPNQVASLLEPVTAEERMAAEKDQSDGQASAGTAVVDPVKRPFLARLVHRLLGLTSSIVCTLVVINRSDTVLRGDIEDVPTWCPLIVPHSKVVLGEPASMGTLLELTSSALDVLSQLVARPTGQALAPPSSISTSVRGAERALDVGEARHTARQTVEVVLMYAATQLGMWLERPEGGDGAGADGEMEEMGEGGERRRESSGLSERVRRGMVVEMGGELRALMERARGVQGKSREGETVDITDVLLRFLNEHVMKSG
ncbi:hypothetical protein OF83DRAFT_1132304 [Amylostereum chailletii]|nr:hypothetical protein OF83DRAFT_1132304 [Amylostereum chailletii]